MGLPEQLEVVAHGATVILATWLGLTVVLRAPRRAGARAFGVLAALLVVWSLSIIVRRLTLDPGVDEVARWFEVAGASLLPPAVLTVATALTVERQTPRWLAISLVGFWAVSIARRRAHGRGARARAHGSPRRTSPSPASPARWSAGRGSRSASRSSPPRSPGSRSPSATSGLIALAGASSRSPCSPSSSARSVACSGSRRRSRTATRGSASRWSRSPSCWPRTPSSRRASSSRPRSPGAHSASRVLAGVGVTLYVGILLGLDSVVRRGAGDRRADRHRPGAGGDGGRLRAGVGARATLAERGRRRPVLRPHAPRPRRGRADDATARGLDRAGPRPAGAHDGPRRSRGPRAERRGPRLERDRRRGSARAAARARRDDLRVGRVRRQGVRPALHLAASARSSRWRPATWPPAWSSAPARPSRPATSSG